MQLIPSAPTSDPVPEPAGDHSSFSAPGPESASRYPIVWINGTDWETQMNSLPDHSAAVVVIEFPYDDNDRNAPDPLDQPGTDPSGGAAAAAYLQACRQVLQQLPRLAASTATIYVADLPRWLPSHGISLEGWGLKFRHWIAVATPAAVPPTKRGGPHVPLMPVHTGILLYTTSALVALHKVREPHRLCRRCNLPLADWGGKKAERNPAGRVISDVWIHGPGSPAEVMRRLLGLAGLRLVDPSHVQPTGSLATLAANRFRPLHVVVVHPQFRAVRVAVAARAGLADTPRQTPPALPPPAPHPSTLARPALALPTLPLSQRPPLATLPADPAQSLVLDTLYVADVVDALGRLPDASVDLAFADPPYNLEKEYSRYDDDRADAEYLRWCEQWLSEYVRILRPTGSLLVVNLPRWAVHHAAFLNQQRAPLYFQHWIAWDALSEPRGRIMPAHYAILYYTKLPTGFVFHPQSVYPPDYCFRAACVRRRDLSAETQPLSDVWYDVHRIRHRRDRDAHPCQLPISLLRRIIEMTTDPGQVVLDGFAGTGSAVVTAYELGRHFIGIDIDPKYLSITASKLMRSAHTTSPGDTNI